MIIVTGAGGRLGRGVVEQLLERVPAAEVGVSVRDPEKVAHLTERGVRVRRGDFADPSTLPEAFAGARQVLVVSVDALGEQAHSLHRAAITAAAAAGAERVLYTSHMGANPDSPFPAMPDHAATEGMLAAAGIPFTSLRNGFYASTVPFIIGPAVETGRLLAPIDGPVSWTDHDDLAEATAKILTDEVAFDGSPPPLTASAALDLVDIARILSELTGRSIERVVVSDDEWVAGLVGRGMPEEQARMLLTLFLAARRGEFAAVDPTLEKLLGHPTRTLRQVLGEHLSGR